MDLHELHLRHGVGVGASKFSQLSDNAIIRAIVVFPHPASPVNKNVCDKVLLYKPFFIMLTLVWLPSISDTVHGLKIV